MRRGGARRHRLPPLLGVPFTVKESIALRGMPNSAGLLLGAIYRADASAPVVQRLTDAGAIPLGVTNTSELTLWIESANRLYGRTSNPYDPARTAGGSSGGEGAAVGSGGSPFGVGVGHRRLDPGPGLLLRRVRTQAVAGLVPNTGMYPPTPGEARADARHRPLTARRAEDLMPLLRIIAGPDGIDPLTRTATLGTRLGVARGLRVATVENSSLLPISRGCAMRANARSERWRPPGRGRAPVDAALVAQRGCSVPRHAAGGVGATTIALLEAAGVPAPTLRRLLAAGRPAHAADAADPGHRVVAASWTGRALERQLQAARATRGRAAEAIGDGVLLHPAHPRPAPRHGPTLGRPWLFTPAAMFNLAGVPATEVPLGLAESGLPLGVQVAAAAGRDHVSIAVALELERVFGGWSPPPSVLRADRKPPHCVVSRPASLRAPNHDGDPLPGSPSLIPTNAPTAGLGTSSGRSIRALKQPSPHKVAPSIKNLRCHTLALSPSGGVAQLVRAPACHAGGRGFESRRSRFSKCLEMEMFSAIRAS